MLQGFKTFVLRGNVIDLAVAFVVGAAFSTLVGAFTKALIDPVVGIFLGGGINAGTITIRGEVIDFSMLLNALITFFITLTVIYSNSWHLFVKMTAWNACRQSKSVFKEPCMAPKSI